MAVWVDNFCYARVGCTGIWLRETSVFYEPVFLCRFFSDGEDLAVSLDNKVFEGNWDRRGSVSLFGVLVLFEWEGVWDVVAISWEAAEFAEVDDTQDFVPTFDR